MKLEIRFHPTFLKELAAIPLKDRKRIERFLFDELPYLHSPDEIPDLKKLKGYKNYYRIRFGDYRAGIRFTNNRLIMERLLHRKDLYKYYP